MKNFSDTSWDRTNDLPICNTAPYPLSYRGPLSYCSCTKFRFFCKYYWMLRNKIFLTYHHHHHHVPEGLGVFPVPWSSIWSWSLHLFLGRPMFLHPLGLYCSACFGSLFVSILCTCCSHFFWYCFISFTMFCAPVFCLIHWFVTCLCHYVSYFSFVLRIGTGTLNAACH